MKEKFKRIKVSNKITLLIIGAVVLFLLVYDGFIQSIPEKPSQEPEIKVAKEQVLSLDTAKVQSAILSIYETETVPNRITIDSVFKVSQKEVAENLFIYQMDMLSNSVGNISLLDTTNAYKHSLLSEIRGLQNTLKFKHNTTLDLYKETPDYYHVSFTTHYGTLDSAQSYFSQYYFDSLFNPIQIKDFNYD